MEHNMILYTFTSQAASLVSSIFGFFRWEWVNGEPTHSEIQTAIRSKVKYLIENPEIDSISSGRITVVKEFDEGRPVGMSVLVNVGSFSFDDISDLEEEAKEL
jgi:hypothetical protein